LTGHFVDATLAAYSICSSGWTWACLLSGGFFGICYLTCPKKEHTRYRQQNSKDDSSDQARFSPQDTWCALVHLRSLSAARTLGPHVKRPVVSYASGRPAVDGVVTLYDASFLRTCAGAERENASSNYNSMRRLVSASLAPQPCSRFIPLRRSCLPGAAHRPPLSAGRTPPWGGSARRAR
jgi:hypothetical protein